MTDAAGPGRLVVCATPIGNLEDVTPRVLRALTDAAVVACEDTSQPDVAEAFSSDLTDGTSTDQSATEPTTDEVTPDQPTPEQADEAAATKDRRTQMHEKATASKKPLLNSLPRPAWV